MILIVDDEPRILRVVSLALDDVSRDIHIAADAESAMDELEHYNPDLMIVDVRLPGMSGTELVKQVRADPKHCNTRILLMSAYQEPGGHQADAFLSKPFDVNELHERVEAVLR